MLALDGENKQIVWISKQGIIREEEEYKCNIFVFIQFEKQNLWETKGQNEEESNKKSVGRPFACMVLAWRPKVREPLETENTKEKNHIDVTTTYLMKECFIHKIVHKWKANKPPIMSCTKTHQMYWPSKCKQVLTTRQQKYRNTCSHRWRPCNNWLFSDCGANYCQW